MSKKLGWVFSFFSLYILRYDKTRFLLFIISAIIFFLNLLVHAEFLIGTAFR